MAKTFRLSVFLCLFLLITSNSSSVVMFDSAINPDHEQELLLDLNRATGLHLEVRKGFIRELPMTMELIPFAFLGDQKGSNTARYLLMGALQSNSLYRIRTDANARLGRASAGIDLNFDQLRSVTYRDVPRQAFGAGMILLHELAHVYRGLIDPDILQQKKNPEIKGPTVEFINRIQRELGLPERLHYFPKKIAGKKGKFCIYFGNVERVELDAALF